MYDCQQPYHQLNEEAKEITEARRLMLSRFFFCLIILEIIDIIVSCTFYGPLKEE
jgi:hypothetical protein